MNLDPRPAGPIVYHFDRFRLEPEQFRLLRDGTPVPLTDKAFQLLLALVHAPGELVTREALIDRLWPNAVVEEQNLTWTVSLLRRSMGGSDGPYAGIETVRGKGYRLTEAVQVSRLPPARASLGVRARRFSGWAVLTALLALAVLLWSLWYGGEKSTEGQTPFRLAILPFENLSPDPDDRYFTVGIRDTIATRLAGISSLRVIAGASVSDYPAQPDDLDLISSQLGGLRAVLTGSVQRVGDEMLVNLRLIDVGTGEHLWAESYNGQLNQLFVLQAEVAEQVVAALKASLMPEEAGRLAVFPTANAEAHDRFLQADYLAQQVEQGTALVPAVAIAQAAAGYREAIGMAPMFALAHARLSYLISYAHWFQLAPGVPGIHPDVAEASARRALEIDDQLPQAHLAMGYVWYWGQRDYGAALRSFERARANLPDSPDLAAAIAYVERRQGNWQSALAGLERAEYLDPRNPNWIRSRGDLLAQMYRYEEAVEAYEAVLALQPDDYNGQARKLWFKLAAGNLDAAGEQLARIPRDIDPGGSLSMVRAEWARLTRQPDLVLDALEQTPIRALGPLAIGATPTDMVRAQAMALKNDPEAAHVLWDQMLEQVREQIREEGENADRLSLQARAVSGLGDHDRALQLARLAVATLPLDDDAVDAPLYLAVLAMVKAAAGLDDAAVEVLAQLMAIPSGVFVSPALLAVDPVWDNLREHPGFQELVASR